MFSQNNLRSEPNVAGVAWYFLGAQDSGATGSMAAIADPPTSFLLTCCASDRAPTQTDERCFCANDWSWLKSSAERHGVLPLVASHLRASAQFAPIEPERRRIILDAYANHLRNQYLTEQLGRLLREFHLASIATLAIKGPVLAAIAYGDPGLRTFADLDLLVRAVDLAAATRLLGRLGFVADLYDEAAIVSGFFDVVEANFRSPNGIVNVDLHWELSPGFYPFGPRGDELWDRAIDVPFDGVQVRTLAHEDHLLYLAVHSSRHGWCALSHICDIAKFVTRVDLDWRSARTRAAATRCSRMLNVALLLAHDLLGAALPATVLEMAQADAPAVALARAVAADFASDTEPSKLRLMQRSLRAIAGLRDRSRYLASHGLAPTLLDFRFRPLPRSLYPLYYFLRPIRIGVVLSKLLFSGTRKG